MSSAFIIFRSIANISNLTSQIPKLGDPIATGSFGKVYKCTISKDKTEVRSTVPSLFKCLLDIYQVAVKVFDIDRKRPMAKIRKVHNILFLFWAYIYNELHSKLGISPGITCVA